MSGDLGVQGVVDPRINMRQAVTNVVPVGPLHVKANIVVADNFGTSGTVTFDPRNSNNDSIVSRFQQIECKLRFTFTSAARAVPWSLGNPNGCLRQLPFQSCLMSSSITLGSQTLTQSVKSTLKPALRLFEDDCIAKCWTGFPSMADKYGRPSDYLVHGLAKHPATPWGSNSYGNTRGSQLFYTNVDNTTPNTTIVDVAFREALICAPWGTPCSRYTSKGLLGSTQTKYVFTLDGSLLTNMWWQAADIEPFDSITVTWLEAPKLHYLEFTPNEETVPLNPTGAGYKWAFNKFNNYVANQRTIAAATGTYPNITPGTITNYVSPSVQIQGLPDLFMVFVRLVENDRVYTEADFFLMIDRLSMNLGNRSAFLAEFDFDQLVNMSQKYIKADYTEMKKLGGFIVAFTLSDLGVPPDMLPGASDCTNMQVTVDVQNLQTRALNVQLEVMTIQNAILTSLGGGRYTEDQYLLDRKDVGEVNMDARDDAESAAVSNAEGGNIFDSAKRWIKHAAKDTWSAAKGLAGPAIATGAAKYGKSALSAGRAFLGLGAYGGQVEVKHDEEDSNPRSRKRPRHEMGRPNLPQTGPGVYQQRPPPVPTSSSSSRAPGNNNDNFIRHHQAEQLPPDFDDFYGDDDADDFYNRSDISIQ